MTNTQKELLQALRCFMQGDEEYHLPERFSQLKELCDLAAMHKILAIIYEMIRRDPVAPFRGECATCCEVEEGVRLRK